MIKDQHEEIDGTSTIDWNTIPWVRSTLSNDGAVELSTAKVFVFTDLVLCVGGTHEYPRSVGAWKEKIEWFTRSPEYRALDCVDG